MTKTMTREQIQQKLESGDPIIIVEALPPMYFDAQHLPGAINIPHDEIQKKALEVLPDKNALIVVYCANTACQNSNIARNLLERMGYSNAYEYVEGKQDWLDANLPTETTS